jgi:4-hydroxybenzoate polyprenyltransferase
LRTRLPLTSQTRPPLAGPGADLATSPLWAYVRLARIDHWFKNVFMLLGAAFAFFYRPDLFAWTALAPIGIALAATCLVASSNYVLNEILDGPRDAVHPLKRSRPVPSGLVRPSIAYSEWLAFGAAGLALAAAGSRPLALSALALWLMGVVYNVPPVRSKEWPYVDVLSESLNNPIRLLLGWFALVQDRFPPLSLLLAYWMAGAFFMGAKRLAEYRLLGAPAIAAAYRSSFRFYTEERLLLSVFFYATTWALFTGVFIVRYHVELILSVPVMSALLAYYLKISLQPNSPAQTPERLYQERKFVLSAVFATATFVTLLFIRIPMLYDYFNIEPSTANRVDPLWTIGGATE